jgi:site-specific recombinase XerD
MPAVPGKRSIGGIISKTENLKHRCLLMLAYSAGLRASEIVSLKIRDVESGTDIRFIQQLPGHNSILTTRRYTHVSLRQITQIRCPLDDLDMNLKIQVLLRFHIHNIY